MISIVVLALVIQCSSFNQEGTILFVPDISEDYSITYS